MFENILGLSNVCDDLRRDISEKKLPGAILLSGPRYGGKSSVALEVARGITCHGTGSWDCTCQSCRLHRTLQHPNTIMIGPRYFSLEIRAAIDAFRREPRQGTRFLLIRSVRKLVRRFDPHLWPDNKIKSALPLAEEIEESLAEFEETSDGTSSDKILGNLEKQTAKLEQQLPHDPVPVDLVRAISSWAYLSSSAGPRVVIVEEAHTLQEGARNGMLKILEEPPVDVLFVLTSSRRSAIIPTIRSRVRQYELPERTEEVQRDVQRRIFRTDSPFGTLRDFFRMQSGQKEDSWLSLSREVVLALEQGKDTYRIVRRIRERLSEGSPRHGAEYFFDALEEEIRNRLRQDHNPVIPLEVLFSWGPIIQRYWGRIDSRNMSPQSVVSEAVIALGQAITGNPR